MAANGVWGRSELLLDTIPDGGEEVRLFPTRALDPPVEFRQVAQHLRQADRRELLVHLLCEPGQPPLGREASLVQHMVGEYVGYLKENMNVQVQFHDNKALSVELPASVELEVVDTEPVIKGATSDPKLKDYVGFANQWRPDLNVVVKNWPIWNERQKKEIEPLFGK